METPRPNDSIMDSTALQVFLRSTKPEVVHVVQWSNGIRLQVACHLCDRVPPLDFVTSVRAVLFTESGVAVLHNADGSHILPWGRREPDEPLSDTLRREIMEETGCALESSAYIGFLHMRHLTPRPDGYRYPYPDFLQLVYAVKGTVVTQEFDDPDGWEEAVEFVPPEKLAIRRLASDQRCFLDRAVELLRRIGRHYKSQQPIGRYAN